MAPAAPQQVVQEQRDNMIKYACQATFVDKQTRQSMVKIYPPPAPQLVYEFQLDNVDATVNNDSSHTKWVKPKESGSTFTTGLNDLGPLAGVADSLNPGDKVDLQWHHDYVTVNGSSGPQYPVTRLVKVGENMVNYKCKATFKGKQMRQSMAMIYPPPPPELIYEFQLDSVDATVNNANPHVQHVKPQESGATFLTNMRDLGMFKGVADSLSPGEKVDLEWNHDYVTINNSAGPQRPVANLAKAGAIASRDIDFSSGSKKSSKKKSSKKKRNQGCC